MSLFTSKGAEAKEKANKQKVDLQKAYIRLKENESIRVRLLGTADYVEYLSQGDFNLGIYTTACIEPAGKTCPLCVAAKSGVSEDFNRLYAKPRYIFAFADIDAKEIRFFDASKTQAKKLMDSIEEYADSIHDIAFTFKRTGTKIETNYSLNPILRLAPADKENFDKFENTAVEMEMFESVLIPRSEEQMIEALKQAKFPVEQYFEIKE